MTLVDPCPTTKISLNQPDPFNDQTYVLRSPQIDQFWNIDSLLTKETQIDCGPITVNFFNEIPSKTAIDPDLFLDERITPGSYNFAVRNTDDILKKGVYPINYVAYFTNYPSNVANLAETFTVTVIDPCDDPALVQASVLTD